MLMVAVQSLLSETGTQGRIGRHKRGVWGLTKVQCALDDGHPGVNDLGLALQQVDSLEGVQQVFQQLTQELTLWPACRATRITVASMLHCISITAAPMLHCTSITAAPMVHCIRRAAQRMWESKVWTAEVTGYKLSQKRM